MPLQNLGTLLENIVVLEAARLLLDLDERELTFANSFAMPLLTPWKGSAGEPGFAALHLDYARVVPDDVEPGSYPGLMRTVLQRDRSTGPNAALLVGGLAARRSARVSMWLSDVLDTHPHHKYEGAIDSLDRLNELVGDLFGGEPQRVRVCAKPYPKGLDHLADRLREWEEPEGRGPILGFLDPNSYRTGEPAKCQTTWEDHREWLALLVDVRDGPVLSVHFSFGTPDTCGSIHADGVSAGLMETLCFHYGPYFVYVNVRGGEAREFVATPELSRALKAGVECAWEAWMAFVREKNPPTLEIEELEA